MTAPDAELPRAVLTGKRRLSLFWLVPAGALCLAGWLAYRTWLERGLPITVQLENGHGLRAGDDIRFRGITVGQVREVAVSDDLQSVIVRGSLRMPAETLARAGSRFWVVRPQLGLERVAGLETLVGPRYLTVLPGTGPRQRRFVGLEEAPPVEAIEPGDLEIVIGAPARGDMSVGGPVVYRDVRVGTILSVGLASDGGAVEARVHIDKPYAQLITPRTRFWRRSGIEASIGLKGVSLEIQSIRSLLSGGISLATPPGGGGPVLTGHRFALEAEPEDEWLEWQPLVGIGSELLPPGSAVPGTLRATLGWRGGWPFKGRRSIQGWVLPTERGLLGPADLLVRGEGQDSPTLEVGGREVPLGDDGQSTSGELLVAIVPVEGLGEGFWPDERIRRPAAPEDCLAFADPGAAPVPLAAGRLGGGDGTGGTSWSIDSALALDETWHGACVLARSDGRLIGILCVREEGEAVVALVPE